MENNKISIILNCPAGDHEDWWTQLQKSCQDTKKEHELSGGRNWEERSDESDPVKLKKDGLTDMCVSLYSMVSQPKTSSPHTTNTKLFVVL